MKLPTRLLLLSPPLLLVTGTVPASAESSSMRESGAHAGRQGVASAGSGTALQPAASTPYPATSSSGELLDEAAGGRDLDRQRDAGFDARLGLGFVVPALSTRFTRAYTAGYQGVLELGYQLGPAARYHLALAAAHSRFFLDDPNFAQGMAARVESDGQDGDPGTDPSSFDVEGGALPTTEILAQLRWDMTTGDWRPYLLGATGAAIFLPRVARYTAPLPASESGDQPGEVRGQRVWEDDVAPVVSVGAGLTDPTGPWGLFAQLRFSWAPGSDTAARWVSVTAGAEL